MIISFKGNGGSGVTTGEVQTMIDASLAGYYTSGQTDSAIDDAVSGKADTSAFTNYYTSGETDNAITTALGDYYTSGETDAAISDAISDINFDKLESVSAFPQSANTGDVVAKVTEGAPMLSWTFPGEYPKFSVTSATVTNTFKWNDFPMDTPYTIASWTSVQNHQIEVVAKRQVITQNTATWEEITLYLYSDGEEVKYGSFSREYVGENPLSLDSSLVPEDEYFPAGNFIEIYFDGTTANTGENFQFVVTAYDGEEDDFYNDSLVPILNLQPFGPASEGTMDVYQYDGTNWNAVGGGAGGNANIVELTQAEYDALVNKDEDAIYVITDAQAVDLGDYAMNSAVTAGLATKADAQSVSANTGTSSPFIFPTWNEQGVITGAKNTSFSKKEVYEVQFQLNNTGARGVLRTYNGNLGPIYAPTSSGTEGQILQSNGNRAPVWTSYKFAFITQTEYDALTTKDANTFYFITGD